jgi:hypothetical protein
MEESEAQRDAETAWELAQRARRGLTIARLIADEVPESVEDITRQLISAWQGWLDLRAANAAGAQSQAPIGIEDIDPDFLPENDRADFKSRIGKLSDATSVTRADIDKHLEWLARALVPEQARARVAAGVPHPARNAGLVTAAVLGVLAVLIGATYSWQQVVTTAPPWRLTLYEKPDFKGRTVTQVHRKVDFRWDEGRPTFRIPNDHFSARVESCLTLAEAEALEFDLLSDDGARLFINGHLVADNWGVHPEILVTERLFIEEGTHHLVVEFFEHEKSARLRLEILGEDGKLPRNSRLYAPKGDPASASACKK